MSNTRRSLLRLAKLRSIVADVVQVPESSMQPNQTVNNGVATNQQTQQTGQSVNLDHQTLLGIARQLNTRDVNQIQNYLQQTMQVPEAQAKQAVVAFGTQIVREEIAKLKAQQKAKEQETINNVAKMMNLSAPDLSKSFAPAPLPGQGASMKRRIRLASIMATNGSLNKEAGITDFIKKYLSMPETQLENFFKERRDKFVDSNGEITEESIKNKLEQLMSTAKMKTSTASIGSKPFGATAMLGAMAGLMFLAETTAPVNPKDTHTIGYLIATIASFGISMLAAKIYAILKNKEQDMENQKKENSKKLYEAFRTEEPK